MIILHWNGFRLTSRRIRSNVYEQICRSGDVRAILTPPSDVTIVKMYKTHYEREDMVPGDVYLGLAYTFGDHASRYNSVRDFTFFMDDSLQSLSFAALVKRDPGAVELRMTKIMRRFMRSS
jgi:hypothetical protein